MIIEYISINILTWNILTCVIQCFKHFPKVVYCIFVEYIFVLLFSQVDKWYIINARSIYNSKMNTA